MAKYKLCITTGDKFGIGKEIIKKALDKLNIDKKDILIVGEKIEGLNYDFLPIEEENNGAFCYEALVMACSLAKEGIIKGIVTAPVSKKELHKAGHIYDGQTEVLEHILDNDEGNAQMLFIANNLKMMLLTRHKALKNVCLTIEETVKKVEILNEFLKEKYKIEKPKLALCGFNPHCGEDGILGREEIEILNPAVYNLNKKGIDITKPISADALFAKVGKEYLNNEKLSYDCIIACYHDQGLAPIKALAFEKAVNTTIGLNVIRTSPTSGTAYDIAGKNIANPNSMIEAIKLCYKLS